MGNRSQITGFDLGGVIDAGRNPVRYEFEQFGALALRAHGLEQLDQLCALLRR